MLILKSFKSWFFCCILLAACTQETSFFVSPDGNDTWSGTKSKPFKTVTAARNAIRKLKHDSKLTKPTTVYLRQGTYELTEPLIFEPQDGGTAQCPVTYKAYNDEKPLISGGYKVTGLQRVDSNLWQATLAEVKDGKFYSRNLFINGQRRFRARHPNEGYLRIDSLLDVNVNNSPYNTPCHRFVYHRGDFKPSMKNLKDIEVVALHFWVDVHLPVDSIDSKKNIVTFTRPSSRRLTDDFNAIPARFYIDNAYEYLDYPGEWYLDRKSGILSYLAKDYEDVKNADVVLGRLPYLMLFKSSEKKDSVLQYINFEGLTFAYTNWELESKDAGDVQAAVTIQGALRGSLKNSKITNCTIRNLGNYAIDLTDGSNDVIISYNEIYDCGGGGIRFTGGDANSDKLLRTGSISVTDNHIHNIGQIYHSAVGVLLQHANNNTIAHNHIHHIYYTAISLGWVWGYSPSVSSNNHIEYNHLHHIGQGMLSDMGGVYMLGLAPGTTVNHNLIHHVRSYGYGGWGIYTDEGSTGVTIENNLVYLCKSSGFHQHYGKENIISNNIFAMNTDGQIERTRNEKHLSFTFEHNIVYWTESILFKANWRENNYKFDNNLYYRVDGWPIMFSNYTPSQWHKKGQDEHSLIGIYPQFNDPDKFDFTLNTNSPAIKQLNFKPLDLSTVGIRTK